MQINGEEVSIIKRCDIVLNNKKNWVWGYSPNALDYKGILTHEFGHVVGLAENSTLDFVNNPDVQTMYPYHLPSSVTINGIYHLSSYLLCSIEEDDIEGKNDLWD